jgi:hypothetical protein
MSMKDRCCNPNNKYWNRYGGRGIKVCDEWINDFARFLSEVGEKPAPEYSIDRIDNDGGYEPGNVRWASPSEQGRNRTRRARISGRPLFDGMNANEIEPPFGTPAETVRRRYRAGHRGESLWAAELYSKRPPTMRGVRRTDMERSRNGRFSRKRVDDAVERRTP